MSTPNNDGNASGSQPNFYSPDYQAQQSATGQAYGSQQPNPYGTQTSNPYGSQQSNPYGTNVASGYPYQQTSAASYQQPTQSYPVTSYDYYPVLADHPQATTILVLGILGIVGLPIVAPFAWVMGNKARKEIQQGLYRENGSITAGWVMGIIGSVLLAIAALALILYLIIFVVIIGALAR